MASPGRDYLKSPFKNVINNLPQGHEKAFKQAIYTTAANLFICIALGAAVAVYFIMEAFLRPLLWAVLCGTFLYPFKRSLTNRLRCWLQRLQSSDTPMAIGLAIFPIGAVNRLYDRVYDKVSNNVHVLVVVLSTIVICYLMWNFGPVKSLFNFGISVLYIIYDILGYFTSFWVWTIIVAYVMVVIFLWTPESKKYLRILSFPVWFLLILHVATIAGSLRVPLFLFLLGLITIGFLAEVKAAQQLNNMQAENEVASPIAAAIQLFADDSEEEAGGSQMKASEGIRTEKISDPGETVKEVTKPSHLPLQSTTKPEGPKILTDKGKDTGTSSTIPDQQGITKRSLSDTCFVCLFWMIVLTRLWIHLWVMQLLLPIAVFLWLVKATVSQFSSSGLLGDKMAIVKSKVHEWFSSRKSVLAPRWVRGLYNLLLRGDHKVVSVLEQSLDKATSILFILLLVFGTLMAAVFCAVQVQQESMHLVKMTSGVINNTLNSELNSWLPNGEDVHKAMDSMVGNAYLYGRNWIASKLREVVGAQVDENNNRNNTMIEKQVLEVWDRLYENWLARNATSSSVVQTTKFQISMEMLNWRSFWEVITKGKGINTNKIVAFIKDNLGTLTSVLESLWLVLKGNMNLVFSLVTVTFSFLFGGGTAVLNFIISSAIFLTTLFYLLASSGKQYKPFEIISSFNPTGTESGNKFGEAVEEAITGVFTASLKMAAFYGLYTWETHTLFGVNIVFIPSALAAVFAAIPFVGTYWAALPAVLDLWLVQGHGVLALLLMLFHLLPTYVVDTAIYSEIKGGHPYLTGLAIAGGIYWTGLEGAIFGPILLCCLLVAVRVYGTMLQPEEESETGGFNLQGMNASRIYSNRKTLSFPLARSLSSLDAR